MSEPSPKPTPEPMSDQIDRRLFVEICSANAQYGTPYLPSPRRQKRAQQLVKRGWLRDDEVQFSPNLESWAAYRVTETGIDAYNAAIEMSR